MASRFHGPEMFGMLDQEAEVQMRQSGGGVVGTWDGRRSFAIWYYSVSGPRPAKRVGCSNETMPG